MRECWKVCLNVGVDWSCCVKFAKDEKRCAEIELYNRYDAIKEGMCQGLL